MCKKIAAVLLVLSFSTSQADETLLECSQIEDAADRVACYDRLAGRVEEKMEETFDGTTEERVEQRTESIAEEVIGSTETVAAPEVSNLEIKRVVRDRARRVTYVTTDGRVFQRSSGSRITFRVGNKCELESGVMNSIFLVCNDGRKNKVKELATK